MRCAVKNCSNKNIGPDRRKWRFFRFPKEVELQQKWIEFCGRDNVNPKTAFICHVHFKEDFCERNMQFEMGFMSKNLTRLKPGAYPTLMVTKDAATNQEQDLLKELYTEKGPIKRQRKQNFNRKIPLKNTKAKENPRSESTDITMDNEPVDAASDLEDMISTDLIPQDESINDPLDNASDGELSDVKEIRSFQDCDEIFYESHHAAKSISCGQVELEIVDSPNPNANADNNVEILDSGSDTYVNHLEIEVTTLKQEVSALKNERKSLIEEILKLKDTVRQLGRLHRDGVDPFKIAVENNGKPLQGKGGSKRTVVLYTANIETIRKLRQAQLKNAQRKKI